MGVGFRYAGWLVGVESTLRQQVHRYRAKASGLATVLSIFGRWISELRSVSHCQRITVRIEPIPE